MKGSKRHNRHSCQKVLGKGLDYELLAKNVFLLMAKKDVVLAHDDMRNCVLNVENYACFNNGVDLRYMPLCGYFEWWDKAKEFLCVNDEGLRGIVIRWSCSPMSGFNNCDIAFEDGHIEKWRIRAFRRDVHLWLAIRSQYEGVLEYPSKLTLRNVIEILNN